MNKILAQADNIVGTITNPLPGKYAQITGITVFFTNILRLIFLGAGIFALLNFIVAGMMYMNAGGDAKYLGLAWAKIWQTLLGLAIMVSSFAMAALFGYLFFGDAGYMLNPIIYGPK
jgi:hypothetical protein